MWGGCMLFRAAEMRGDARGILRVSSCAALIAVCHAMGLAAVQQRICRLLASLPDGAVSMSASSVLCLNVTHYRQRQGAVSRKLASPRCPHFLLSFNLQAWEDGGYSDDLTVASKCTELQLPIYCPGYAIFPQW